MYRSSPSAKPSKQAKRSHKFDTIPTPIKTMDDLPIDKIQISGTALAALLDRSSTAVGDTHGHLFGHATYYTPDTLFDDPNTTVPSVLVFTVTSFISVPSHLPLPPPPPSASGSTTLLGCFSARRKTPFRPSLSDSVTTASLSTSTSLAFAPPGTNLSLPPSLFLLITTPFKDQLIHTHEYRAFQFRGGVLEAKGLNIVNIGPCFRPPYDSYSSSVPFPLLECELMDPDAMVEDERGDNFSVGKNSLKDQKQLDNCALGYDVGRLSNLMSSDAAHTEEFEELYSKMLAKIEALSKLVEQTNAKVQRQENHNMRLRHRVAGL